MKTEEEELAPVLSKAPKRLLWAQKIANLSDTAVRIPGINIRLGLDFIIGLIPVIGDVLMLGASLTLIGLARSLGVPKSILMLMLRNAAIDFVVGMVPFLGDLFDLFFKANQRNVRMLERWWVAEHHEDIQQATQQKLRAWTDDKDRKSNEDL